MLSDVERQFLAHQPIAHLATADRRAVPHVVPVCFAILEIMAHLPAPLLYRALGQKRPLT